MWLDEESRELKERISQLSDDELLNMVEDEPDAYRQEALNYARAELMARGIQFQEAQASSNEDAASAVGQSEDLTCTICGGTTRPGILFADRELTIVFSDNDEERFVEVYACSQCGQVQIMVDFETDVRR